MGIWRCYISGGVPRRLLSVGTILNLINQGDASFSDCRWHFWKLILTFAVPDAVATYGARVISAASGFRLSAASLSPLQRLVLQAENRLRRAKPGQRELAE